jgi:hypothetical protein
VNLSADQTRQQLVLMASRAQSMQETLRSLLLREPRLTAYLDQIARDLKTMSWDIKQAGENIDLLYTHVWPPLDFEVAPVEMIGHARVSPRDAGWPFRRTGRPLRPGE